MVTISHKMKYVFLLQPVVYDIIEATISHVLEAEMNKDVCARLGYKNKFYGYATNIAVFGLSLFGLWFLSHLLHPTQPLTKSTALVAALLVILLLISFLGIAWRIASLSLALNVSFKNFITFCLTPGNRETFLDKVERQIHEVLRNSIRIIGGLYVLSALLAAILLTYLYYQGVFA